MKRIILTAAAALIGLAASAQQFAHVNLQEVIQLMPDMDQARIDMETIQKDVEETYASMMQEFQSKYQQYEQKAATWTASVRESKEKELGEIQNRIQEFAQSSQQELQEMQNAKMAPIYQKAQEAVNKIAKAQGFIYVFDMAQMLYIDPAQSKDITPEVRLECGVPEGRTLEALQQELQAKAAAMAE